MIIPERTRAVTWLTPPSRRTDFLAAGLDQQRQPPHQSGMSDQFFESRAPETKGDPKSNAAEFTVSEISNALKRTVEDAFGNVRVRGEISGYRGPHSSGRNFSRAMVVFHTTASMRARSSFRLK